MEKRLERKPKTSTTLPKPYPYEILPVPAELLEASSLKNLDPWRILEFLRIEALLRSETVMNQYSEPGLQFGHWLRETYHVGVPTFVLGGSHHIYLLSSSKQSGRKAWEIGEGIIDLANLAQSPNGSSVIQEVLQIKNPRYLHVRLDTARPPTTLWNSLKPILKEQFEQVKATHGKPRTVEIEYAEEGNKKVARFQQYPWYGDPRKAPRINLRSWVNYLHCYDLRTGQGLSFGEVARQVYGTGHSNQRSRNRDRAEKAVNRVKKLIDCAEQKNWPPPPAVFQVKA
ncbi:MAG: hypothetical protein IH977_15315 [Nitrospinae bacterium]|nr:hypothetical protein [Nitrospinota bacterium]